MWIDHLKLINRCVYYHSSLLHKSLLIPFNLNVIIAAVTITTPIITSVIITATLTPAIIESEMHRPI